MASAEYARRQTRGEAAKPRNLEVKPSVVKKARRANRQTLNEIGEVNA
jgi:hypothetical protein